ELAAPADGSARHLRHLRVSDDERERMATLFVDPTDTRNGADVRIVLQPWRNVTIQVVDATDRPVEDATVVLLENGWDLAVEKTGRDGTSKLRVPAKLLETSFCALKAGVGYDYFSSLEQRPLPDDTREVEVPSTVKLTLSGARSVRIRTTDGSGAPLAGV